MRFEKGYFKDHFGAVSNYRDYTRRRHGELCEDLISLGMSLDDKIVDFGCATGSLLAEFTARGFYDVTGTDVSYWAIIEGRECYEFRPDTLQFLNYNLLADDADWLLALDVLEHVGNEELGCLVELMRCKHLVIRVPVCGAEGEPYVIDVSRKDSTHTQCHTKEWWLKKLSKFTVSTPIVLSSIYESEGVLARVFSR